MKYHLKAAATLVVVFTLLGLMLFCMWLWPLATVGVMVGALVLTGIISMYFELVNIFRSDDAARKD